MKVSSLNKTSVEIENPSQITEAPQRVNVDDLKQRIFNEKKKEKLKKTIIVTFVVASLGVLTFFTY